MILMICPCDSVPYYILKDSQKASDILGGVNGHTLIKRLLFSLWFFLYKPKDFRANIIDK
jgi:hypothetical protein